MRIRVCPAHIFEGLEAAAAGIQLVTVGIFAHYVKSGDGIVVYSPNSDHSQCEITALCEVIATYAESGQTSLDVRPKAGTLQPDSHARWRWAKNPYLCLDASKVKKYGILELFSETFEPEFWNPNDLEDCVREVFRPDLSIPTLIPTEGVIYVLRGSSLFKIGKTTELSRRIKRIEKDVSESLEIVHTISSNDITRAEITLHKRFGDVRIWGEWFALSSSDVDELCAIDRMLM